MERSEGSSNSEEYYEMEVLAEMAFCKAFGLRQYLTDDPDNDGDVGGIRVRPTRHPDAPLVIRRGNPDHVPYVKVICQGRSVSLVGWILAKEAKRPEWWDNHTQAWQVPETALRRDWAALVGQFWRCPAPPWYLPGSQG